MIKQKENTHIRSLRMWVLFLCLFGLFNHRFVKIIFDDDKVQSRSEHRHYTKLTQGNQSTLS